MAESNPSATRDIRNGTLFNRPSDRPPGTLFDRPLHTQVEVERQLQNVVSAVANGADFGLFHDKMQSLQSQKRRLEEESISIKRNSGGATDRHDQAVEIVQQLRDLKQVLANGTPRRRKELIRRFVPKIEVSKTEATEKVYVRRLPALGLGKSLSELEVVGDLVTAGGRNRTDTRFRSHRILSPARLPISPLRRRHIHCPTTTQRRPWVLGGSQNKNSRRSCQ